MKELYNRDLRDLWKSKLFCGFEEEDMLRLLATSDMRVVEYRKGDIIRNYGEETQEIGVLLRGTAFVEFSDVDGSKVNLSALNAGDEIGGFLAIGGESFRRIMIYAGSPCRILFISDLRRSLLEGQGELNAMLTKNLLRHWSEKLRYLYQRLILFSRRQVQERIRLYLMSLPRVDSVVEVPMNRTEWADYLGMHRTVLSRELTRMQQAGTIGVEGRRITLLDCALFDEAQFAGAPCGDGDGTE